ncbi:unnamed protein product [Brassicogethes aeneus]|uniref:Cohesin subunit SCC3/SA HEAT-repeats domain-containing protein n=1 Tax=Brassicogethes aeneus TaxID=1431903 RepID=A0A9P0AQY6_BRAAE|nr:unnamed protein product [Brassicogethes aeneus]
MGDLSKKISSLSQPHSTPKKARSEQILSPQFSSINTSLIEFDDPDDYEETLDNSADYDTYFNTAPRKIPRSGNIWQEFKPIRNDGLYYNVIFEPDQAERHAKYLLESYETGAKSVMLEILQFFIDTCGFQSINISELYNFSNIDMTQVISAMEKTKKEITRHGIFDLNQRLPVNMRMGIFNFVQKLLQVAYENNIVFRDTFAKHTLNCLYKLASSEMYCIKLTGAILCSKFLTEFSCMYNQLENDGKTKHRERLLEYMEYMFTIFTKNWFIGDKRWNAFKREVAKEMKFWLKYCPSMFTSSFDMIPYISRCLKDESSLIRKEILNTCESLIKGDDINEVKSKFINELHHEICNRNLDVNDDVAIKALNIWKYMQNNHPKCITYNRDMKSVLLANLYISSFPIAQAAAELVYDILKKDNEEPKKVLIKLSDQLSNEDNSHLGSFLVEAFFNYDEITHWESYISLMANSKIAIDRQENLFKMAYYSVYQTLKGCPRHLRYKSITGPEASTDVHVNVGRHFLTNIPQFLNKFEAYPGIIINILDIVLLINTSDNYGNIYQNILSNLNELFNLYENSEVLEKIAEVLYFLKNNRQVANVNKLLDVYSNLYMVKSLESSENPQELKLISLKISILFSKFDLTEIPWENLYIWKTNEEYTEHLVVACKWYLIWTLRKIICNIQKPNNVQINNLKAHCNIYTRRGDLIFTLSNITLGFKMFIALTELYKKFAEEFQQIIQSPKTLDKLKLKMGEDENRYFEYLGKKIIENKDISIKDKQRCVVGAVELIWLTVASSERFINIFKHYHSHFNEIGYIIEDALVDLKPYDRHHNLIMRTIFEVYKDIRDKHESFSMDDAESKLLKSLAKQFSLVKSVKFELEFVLEGIQIALSDEKNLLFLYTLTHFLEGLTQDEKDIAKKYIQTRAKNNKFHNKESVVYFYNRLSMKNRTVTTVVKKAKPKRPPKLVPKQLKVQIEKVAKSQKKDLQKGKSRSPSGSETTNLSLLTIHDESGDNGQISEFDSDEEV